MRKILLLTASMMILSLMVFADVVVEPPATETATASAMPLIFVGAAVVCVAIAVLVWFVRKRK